MGKKGVSRNLRRGRADQQIPLLVEAVGVMVPEGGPEGEGKIERAGCH